MSEAEENDKKLVESLSGDTNSMLILVRGASTNFKRHSILLLHVYRMASSLLFFFFFFFEPIYIPEYKPETKPGRS
jgi:hypothetical protein